MERELRTHSIFERKRAHNEEAARVWERLGRIQTSSFRVEHHPPGPPFRHLHYYVFFSCPLTFVSDVALVLKEQILSQLPWPAVREEESESPSPTLLIGVIPECWLPLVKEFVAARTPPTIPCSLEYPAFRFEFSLLSENAISPRLSPPRVISELNLVCDSLGEEDIPFIQPFHSIKMSDEYISMCIRLSPSVCIRKPDSREPVAWMLQYPNDGSLGFLEVVPEMQRKGLGCFCVQTLVERVRKGDPGLPFVHCYVHETNEASLGLFGKRLGWERIEGKFTWLRFGEESQ